MTLMAGMKKDFEMKLLAVFAAVALWYVATPPGESRKSLAVPVVLENVPAHLTVEGTPQVIRIVVSGPEHGRIMRDKSDQNAVLDLNGLGPGTVSFDSQSAIRLGRGFRIVRIQPSRIELKLTVRE
jgi:hypothetical protein